MTFSWYFETFSEAGPNMVIENALVRVTLFIVSKWKIKSRCNTVPIIVISYSGLKKSGYIRKGVAEEAFHKADRTNPKLA